METNVPIICPIVSTTSDPLLEDGEDNYNNNDNYNDNYNYNYNYNHNHNNNYHNHNHNYVNNEPIHYAEGYKPINYDSGDGHISKKCKLSKYYLCFIIKNCY